MQPWSHGVMESPAIPTRSSPSDPSAPRPEARSRAYAHTSAARSAARRPLGRRSFVGLVTGAGALGLTGILSACTPGSGVAAITSGDSAAASSLTTVTTLSSTSGSVVGGDAVTITGSGLDRVASITVGDATAAITESAADALTFTVPPAASFAEGPAAVVLADDGGAPIETDALQYDYALLTPVDRQLSYLLAHFDDTGSDEFGYYDENDCVNFTSQGLLARGWEQDDEWWYSNDGGDVEHGKPWISSTYLMNYLLEHPERATVLGDDQRDQLKLGDVVQFDWDNSGDRDHTGTVTRLETDETGAVVVYFAGHTDNTDFRSVDWAITTYHPGASVYYWSIA